MTLDRKSDFRRLLQYRIRYLRENANFTRKDMAKVLDVFEDTYKKWELSPSGTMPAYFYVKFCTIVRADLEEFLTSMPNEDERIAVYAQDTAISKETARQLEAAAREPETTAA